MHSNRFTAAHSARGWWHAAACWRSPIFVAEESSDPHGISGAEGKAAELVRRLHRDAEDLARRGIAQPKQIGIRGGSNGGLLIGAALTQRPELFGAAVAQVPLLDTRRYNKLLAGAELDGRTEIPMFPEQWSLHRQVLAPYQNVRKDVRYPPTLFVTSTRDDRVHPAHACKMFARMREQGHDVWYYENIEGGHGAASNNEQRALMTADRVHVSL